MPEKRFSNIVAEYYRKKNVYPVTLIFRNEQVDDEFLLEIDKEIQNTFADRDDIKLIQTMIVEGDFWSGILAEFNQSEFDGVNPKEEYFNGLDNKPNTLISTISEIYKKYDECGTRITGVSTGNSVHSVACLESLGTDYFKTPNDVYNGPTID